MKREPYVEEVINWASIMGYDLIGDCACEYANNRNLTVIWKQGGRIDFLSNREIVAEDQHELQL